MCTTIRNIGQYISAYQLFVNNQASVNKYHSSRRSLKSHIYIYTYIHIHIYTFYIVRGKHVLLAVVVAGNLVVLSALVTRDHPL